MKVRLYQPHAHAGQRFTPPPGGQVVDLPAAAVAWLRQHTTALTPPPGAPAPVPAPTPEPPAAPADE